MPPHLSRRALLGATGTALAVAIAGCQTDEGGFSADAALRMDPVDYSALPPEVLPSIGTDDGPDQRTRLMDEILDGGATFESTGPPLPEEQHIYYNGNVYVLAHELVEQTPATKFDVNLAIPQGTAVDSEAVQFSVLPAVDREKFAARGWDDGGRFGYVTEIPYTRSEQEQSALVPESEYSYIVWEDGSEAAWYVNDSQEATMNTYEYAAERYATAAEYGRWMRDHFAFELAGLADYEASIVQTAVAEGLYVVEREQTPTPAFWSLVDRFERQEPIHGLDSEGEEDSSRPYLVRYDGEVYRTLLVVNIQRTAT